MAKKKKSAGHSATAAIELLTREKIPFATHRYEHHDGAVSFGSEAAAMLGRSERQVFKTLMVHHEKNYAVCVVPVAGKLSLKRAAATLGWKSAEMADPLVAQRRSGYVVGGISPLGQKISHLTVLDDSARLFETILISGGKRGVDVELSPTDLLKLTGGSYASIAVL